MSSLTPERHSYPTRGNISSNPIALKNQKSISSKDNSLNQSSSVMSEGAHSFKPSLSKPSVHTGDIPGLGKQYDPMARHQRRPSNGASQRNGMNHQFLTQNESLLKQLQDRQNQTTVYQNQQNMSFQHKPMGMNISRDEKKKLNQTNVAGLQNHFLNDMNSPAYSEIKQLKTDRHLNDGRSLAFSPIVADDRETPMSQGMGNFLQFANNAKQKNIYSNQVSDVVSRDQSIDNDYFKTTTAKMEEQKRGRNILAYTQDKSKAKNLSVDSSSMMDCDEHPQYVQAPAKPEQKKAKQEPQIVVKRTDTLDSCKHQDEDEEIVLDFRRLESITDPETQLPTITSRPQNASPLQQNLPKEKKRTDDTPRMTQAQQEKASHKAETSPKQDTPRLKQTQEQGKAFQKTGKKPSDELSRTTSKFEPDKGQQQTVTKQMIAVSEPNPRREQYLSASEQKEKTVVVGTLQNKEKEQFFVSKSPESILKEQAQLCQTPGQKLKEEPFVGGTPDQQSKEKSQVSQHQEYPVDKVLDKKQKEEPLVGRTPEQKQKEEPLVKKQKQKAKEEQKLEALVGKKQHQTNGDVKSRTVQSERTLVKAEIDVDAILKQARKKKKVKKRKPENSNSFYSESVWATTINGSVFEEEHEDELDLNQEMLRIQNEINKQGTDLKEQLPVIQEASQEVIENGRSPVSVKDVRKSNLKEEEQFFKQQVMFAYNQQDGPNRNVSVDSFVEKAREDIEQLQGSFLNKNSESFISSSSQIEAISNFTGPNENPGQSKTLNTIPSQQSLLSLNKTAEPQTLKNSISGMISVQQNSLQTLKPVGDIPQHFKQKDKKVKQKIITYELGSKAIELATPNYANCYNQKLKHSVKQANGEPAPQFIKAKVSSANTRLIKIYSQDEVGEQKKYDLVLKVYHKDNGIFDLHNFILNVKPSKKFEVIKMNFDPNVAFAIKGPALDLALPTYSLDHSRLNMWIGFQDEKFELQEMPSFIRITSHLDGQKVITLHGNNKQEVGNYKLQVFAKDIISGITNAQAKFEVIASLGIQVVDLPPAYSSDVTIKASSETKIVELPTFNNEGEDLHYEVMDENGHLEIKEGCLHVKEWPEYDTSLQVTVIASNPNTGAKQAVPLLVHVNSNKTRLELVKQNIQSPVKYWLKGKPLMLQIPVYKLQNSTCEEAQSYSITDVSNGNSLEKLICIEDGQLKIYSDDLGLKGSYMVKITATCNQYINNQVVFQLRVLEPVLILSKELPEAYRNQIQYRPDNKAVRIPLPTFKNSSVQFRIVNQPSFIKLENKEIVIKGREQPTEQEYSVQLVASEELSGSQETFTIKIQPLPYQLKLEKWKVDKEVVFLCGNYLKFELPVYNQTPYDASLQLSLESDCDIAKIEGKKLVVSGGTIKDSGSHVIRIKATDPVTSISNNEASFILVVQAQLEVELPVKLEKLYELEVGQKPLLVDLPKFKNSVEIAYSLICPDEQKNITIIGHQIQIQTTNPKQDAYEVKLEATETKYNLKHHFSFTVKFSKPLITTMSENESFATTQLQMPFIDSSNQNYEIYSNREEPHSPKMRLSMNESGSNLSERKSPDSKTRRRKDTRKQRSSQQVFNSVQSSKQVDKFLEDQSVESSSRSPSPLKAEVQKQLSPKPFFLIKCRPCFEQMTYSAQFDEVGTSVKPLPLIGFIKMQSEFREELIAAIPDAMKETFNKAASFTEELNATIPDAVQETFFKEASFKEELIVTIQDTVQETLTKEASFDQSYSQKSDFQISKNDSLNQRHDSEDSLGSGEKTLPDELKPQELNDPTMHNPYSYRRTNSSHSEDEDDISKIVRQGEEFEVDEIMKNFQAKADMKQERQDRQRKEQQRQQLKYVINQQCQTTSPARNNIQESRDDKHETISNKIISGESMAEYVDQIQRNPFNESLVQFREQLAMMQHLQQQQIQAQEANQQLILMQQKMNEHNLNQSYQQTIQSQPAQSNQMNAGMDNSSNNGVNFGNNQIQQLHQLLSSNQALFDEIKLQEDFDLNQQIKLQIQQSIQRRQQQQQTLEQLQAERSQHRMANFGESNFLRNLQDHSGQLRDKDGLVQQLKFELSHIQEQRAQYRSELNSVMQREDDIQAEIFFKEMQIKNTSLRNSELSTKISETQFSMDRQNYSARDRHMVYSARPKYIEEDYITSVSHFDDHEMDNKVLTAAKQLEKLKLEINDLRKNIAVSEVQIEHNQSKFVNMEKHLNESQMVKQERVVERPKYQPPTPVAEDVDDTYMTEDLMDESSYYSPPPQKLYAQTKSQMFRPKDNNIFGTPEVFELDPDDERNRFSTTYTQFSNHQKFRGAKQGEHGGLVLKKHRLPQPIYAEPETIIEENDCAGMRSDHKQRRLEMKEKLLKDKADQSFMINRTQSQKVQLHDAEDRNTKLVKYRDKLVQERQKLMKMLQLPSTSNAARRNCEQQLTVCEDKLQIVKGKLKRL